MPLTHNPIPTLLLLLLHSNSLVLGQSNTNYGQQDQQEFAQLNPNPYGQQNPGQGQAQSPFGQQSLSQGPYGQPNQQVGQSAYGSQVLGSVNRTALGFGLGSGIRLEVLLRSYYNSGFKLGPDGSSCRCPTDQQLRSECIARSPTRMDFPCMIAFMVVVSSVGGPVQYRTTQSLLLDERGGIQAMDLPRFQHPMVFDLESQPVSVDVFVQAHGAVITPTGQIDRPNEVTHVDTFSLPLLQHIGTANSPPQTLSGSTTATQLQLTVSIACKGDQLVGPGCDLKCNSSTANSAAALCVNVRTGFFSLCRWSSSSGQKQVTDCKNCPWGIKENAFCRDEHGGVLEADHVGVVSDRFQTATIALAVVAALLAVCLLAFCLYQCRGGVRKSSPSRSAPGYNSGVRTTSGEPESTALNSSGPLIKSPPSRNNTLLTNASFTPPTPAPRYSPHVPPPLGSRPNKSSMRSPVYYQLPPPAHLGGASSLNDTLNSSFAGSQVPPLPPSISADV